MKPLASVLAIVLTAATPSGVGVATIPAPPQTWGASTAGLRVGLSPVGSAMFSSSDVEFDAAFENTGDSDLIINLGLMLGNGKSMFPTNLGLLLTDPAGQTRELHFQEPRVAGRVDDFLVPLRRRSTHTLRIALKQYWSPATKEFDLKLAGGRYRIAARFDGRGVQFVNGDMQGVALLSVWRGAAQSNVMDFEVRPVVPQ